MATPSLRDIEVNLLFPTRLYWPVPVESSTVGDSLHT